MLPPASSIFLRAASENCVAATVTFTFSLPLPRTCEKKREHTQDLCSFSASQPNLLCATSACAGSTAPTANVYLIQAHFHYG